MCNNDNCEKKPEDLTFFLDGYIDKTADDAVTIPREEYAELIAEVTILRVVERVIESNRLSSYQLNDFLMDIISIGKLDPEPNLEPDPQPDENPSLPDSDEEDAE